MSGSWVCMVVVTALACVAYAPCDADTQFERVAEVDYDLIQLSGGIEEYAVSFCGHRYELDHAELVACVNDAMASVPFGFQVPVISEIDDVRLSEAIAATSAASTELLIFVCNRIVQFFGEIDADYGADDCEDGIAIEHVTVRGYGDLSELYPTVVITIQGRSTELAAERLNDWEYHTLSFQILRIPDQASYAFSTLINSYIERNRDDLPNIVFDTPLGETNDGLVERFFNGLVAQVWREEDN